MDETPRAGRSRSAEELLDEIDRLRAEVEALRKAPPEVRQPDDAEPEATSRRGMLRLAGVATAAAIAGGLAKASPAAAADPNDVVRDANNPVAGTTILSGSVNAELLRLTNTGAGGRGLLATSAGTDIGAVRGDNSNSTGIGGVGVSGNAPGGRDFLAFGSGRIGMNSHSFTTVDNQYTTGEIHQTNGTLYAMVNTTTRRSIVGPATAGALYVINPARVYDSRLPAPAPGVLASGTNRVVSVADARDLTTGAVTTANLVPPGATAIVCNLTVTQTASSGFLAVTSAAVATFSASLINWSSSGSILANASVVPVDASRQIRVYCGGGGSAHFVVDVTGYYL